ncbi:MAG: oxidoreductase [Rhodobacteraceae bacterium]|nr:oxidoreductase [Paracoccaceae bacterium]
MKTKLAIIGDRFMRAEEFRQAIAVQCGDVFDVTLHELPWPDEPMEHGYARAGIEGLKEYQGTAEMVVDLASSAKVLVTQLAPLSASVFAALPELELVVVSRGGPVNVDLRAAHDHDVTIVNTPGRNSSAVAEFTIGAILAETRLMTRGHDALRKGIYRGDLYRSDVIGDELIDLTVGVVGYGTVGRLVVKLLKAFEGKILVSDPYASLSPEDRKHPNVSLASLDELLKRSHVVTLHPRVTPETVGMMNAEAFSLMRPGAVFVNTARGPLVDYEALLHALRSGRLGGAMLDTYSVEPVPPDSPLLQIPNVTLAPHIAGASYRTIRTAARAAALEIRSWIEGKPPTNRCWPPT